MHDKIKIGVGNMVCTPDQPNRIMIVKAISTIAVICEFVENDVLKYESFKEESLIFSSQI